MMELVQAKATKPLLPRPDKPGFFDAYVLDEALEWLRVRGLMNRNEIDTILKFYYENFIPEVPFRATGFDEIHGSVSPTILRLMRIMRIHFGGNSIYINQKPSYVRRRYAEAPGIPDGCRKCHNNPINRMT